MRILIFCIFLILEAAAKLRRQENNFLLGPPVDKERDASDGSVVRCALVPIC
jgi:hypothetical protein